MSKAGVGSCQKSQVFAFLCSDRISAKFFPDKTLRLSTEWHLTEPPKVIEFQLHFIATVVRLERKAVNFKANIAPIPTRRDKEVKRLLNAEDIHLES